MIAELLEQSLRGSLAVSVVWMLDRWLARRMRANSRRLLWLLVALAFLLPWKISLLPSTAWKYVDALQVPSIFPATPDIGTETEASGLMVGVSWPVLIWLAGVTIYLGVLVVQTLMARNRWSRDRLCTDSRLLELVEDCKRISGVTAPIGLVVSERVSTPALLGWLRPRILLPSGLAETLTTKQLSGIFLHELAHFRWLDIPTGWLLALVNAVHWFNPFAWIAISGWKRFREEAADEVALGWLGDANGEVYGETLLQILRFESRAGAAAPFGSLAIGESLESLKKRMLMIMNYKQKKAGYGFLSILAVVLIAITVVIPARAKSEQEQVLRRITEWVKKIDDGKYAEAWSNSSEILHKKMTEPEWMQFMQTMRLPLGQCLGRKLQTMLRATIVPVMFADGTVYKVGLLKAESESIFENSRMAREIVSFGRNSKGEWSAIDYSITLK
jgi:beta-lactamase regulating signal transducer with metallopeptidase domain